jgi:hypothetical protein
VETAARCILAVRGIADPTPEQIAGATLEARSYDDMRRILFALTGAEVP